MKNGNALGQFLRARRIKLDPNVLGVSTSHRRTPGLRREEVARRALISTSYYIWVEQGRRKPSAKVLERLAQSLLLSKDERAELFSIAERGEPSPNHSSAERYSSSMSVLDQSDDSALSTLEENALGEFLKGRRKKLDAGLLGLDSEYRRARGLRREEVAQRARISTTYYTWLEQGRRATPSADVLSRIAQSLALTGDECAHLFRLAQTRLPPVNVDPVPEISPDLQRMLDALVGCPAVLLTTEWDVLASNRAAHALFAGHGASGIEELFNLLEHLFLQPADAGGLQDNLELAHAVVEAFRGEATRAGLRSRARALVEGLGNTSSCFKALWHERRFPRAPGGVSPFPAVVLKEVAFEVSTFGVATMPFLNLMVFNPTTEGDRVRLRQLIQGGELERLVVARAT